MSLDRKLRILHVLNHVRETGNGIVNATIDLACNQAQQGHRVAVASAGGQYEALLKQYGVEHFELNQHRTLENIPKMVREYCRIVKTVRPHVVHGHMMVGVLLAWGYRHYERIQSNHGVKLFSFLANDSSSQSRQEYAICATVHNEFQRNATLMGLADQLICVSQAVANAMQQRGIAKSKLQVVLNGTLGSPRQRQKQSSTSVGLSHPAIVPVAGLTP